MNTTQPLRFRDLKAGHEQVCSLNGKHKKQPNHSMTELAFGTCRHAQKCKGAERKDASMYYMHSTPQLIEYWATTLTLKHQSPAI